MKLRTKILSLTGMAVLVSTIVSISTVYVRSGPMQAEVVTELNKLGQDEVTQVARNVWLMCRVQHENLLQKLESDLDMAKELLDASGGVHLSTETATWQVDGRPVTLPKMMIGESWFGQVSSPASPTPVLDDLVAATNGAVAIFQTLNEAGDLVRVATTVLGPDGKRALGTTIPMVKDDGTPHPVATALKAGQHYFGQTYIQGEAYIAGYEPLLDGTTVIGALGVAFKQESVKAIREGIMDIVVGKTGYVFVLGGKDEDRGHYIISAKGKRDGENVLEAKDDSGREFIKSIVDKAVALKEDGTGAIPVDYETYPWKNEGESVAREKLAAIAYFEPWDWAIGASTYKDDYLDAIGNVEGAVNGMIGYTSAFAAAIFTLVMIGALLLSTRISRPLAAAAAMLKDIAQGEGDLTRRLEIQTKDEVGEMALWFDTFIAKLQGIVGNIAGNSQSLAGASEELSSIAQALADNMATMTGEAASAAAATEEASANIGNVAAGVEESSANSNTVATAAEEVSANLNNVGAAVEQMSSSIGTISSATDEMNNSINSVAAAIEEMTASLSEVAKNAGQAAQVANSAAGRADKTASIVNELGASADEIGKVVDVIKGIASQTNLLALNATIEAASAGEAGKGFTVVASEVKELAKQTSRATEDIRIQIGAMQSTARQAVVAIAEITEIIREIDGISNSIAAAVEEQSATTCEISNNVAGTARSASEVARSVQETATGANEVSRNVQEAINGGNEISRNIGELASGSSVVAQNATEAAVGMNSVAENVANVLLAAKQADQAARDTRESASSLATLASELNSLVEQFKI
ncbi:MAG: Cache 3/Cache 2 fusion domain-containing protein [Candidatus Hydrogenedentes bacterium]|nr:Cache 3/Cache 2 fusion domain-containing protein [Candidatus Hydrogenedentota bacterium]